MKHLLLALLLLPASVPLAARQAGAPATDPDAWTGTIRNAPTPQNANPNPNVRAVTVATRMVADPHWRWRGGPKEIAVRAFNLPNASFPLSGFALEGDRLSYSYTRPGPEDEVRCVLTRQADGLFTGACRAEGGGFNVLIALSPPKGTLQDDGAHGREGAQVLRF